MPFPINGCFIWAHWQGPHWAISPTAQGYNFWFCPGGSWNMIFRSTACVQHLCKVSDISNYRHASLFVLMLYIHIWWWHIGTELLSIILMKSKNKNDAIVLTSWRALQSNQSWPTKGKSSREIRTLNCTCVNTRAFNIAEIVLICLVSFATPVLPYLAGIRITN